MHILSKINAKVLIQIIYKLIYIKLTIFSLIKLRFKIDNLNSIQGV